MHSLIPLITHHGHFFARIDGQDWIVDTGSPVSFGNDAVLALAGQSFAVPQDYMGLTAAALSDLIDHPTAGIIGTDILNRFDLVFDTEAGTLTLADDVPSGDGGVTFVNADLKLTRFSGGCRLKTDTPLSH